jgi:hypothetical protein
MVNKASPRRGELTGVWLIAARPIYFAPEFAPENAFFVKKRGAKKSVGLNGFAVAALLRAGAYPVERLERGFRPLGGGRSYDNSVA